MIDGPRTKPGESLVAASKRPCKRPCKPGTEACACAREIVDRGLHPERYEEEAR